MISKRSVFLGLAVLAVAGVAMAFPGSVPAEVLPLLVGVGALTETRHAGEFILSEANGHRSRENVTIVSGQDLEAGAVLGKITSGGKYTAVNQGASDGSQTVAGILIAKCDASGGDVAAAIIARDAEVNGECLDWGSESAAEITTGRSELLTLGIIVR